MGEHKYFSISISLVVSLYFVKEGASIGWATIDFIGRVCTHEQGATSLCVP